jgi:hypothetical protein
MTDSIPFDWMVGPQARMNPIRRKKRLEELT